MNHFLKYRLHFVAILIVVLVVMISIVQTQTLPNTKTEASDVVPQPAQPTNFHLPVWCGKYLYLVEPDNSHPEWTTETIYRLDPENGNVTKVLATDTLVKTRMNCHGDSLVYATAEFHQLDLVNLLNLKTNVLSTVQSSEISFVQSMAVKSDGSYLIHNGRAIYEYSAKNEFIDIVTWHAQGGMTLSSDNKLAYDEEMDEKATQRVAVVTNGTTTYLPEDSNSASWCGTDYIAFRMNQNEIYLHIGPSNVLITDMRFEHVGAPNCSPDGHSIAFTATEKGVRGTYIYQSGARGIRSQLYRIADPGNEFAWDSVSRQLAIISDEGKVTIIFE